MTRGNETYWHVFEAIGSVKQLTDTQSQVPDAYFYDAWGNELATRGNTVNPHRYVGKHGYYLDTQSALMLLGVRYYSANIGRFWSSDPVTSGLNWYAYVHNPSMWIDPSGLQFTTPPWGSDTDRDGIPDDRDPFPSDPSNGNPSPPIVIIPTPPVHNTWFDIDPNCRIKCPYLTIALDLAVLWIRTNPECTFQYNRICQPLSPNDQPKEYCVPIPGAGNVNCGGRRPERVRIRCVNLSGVGGQAPSCGEIEINSSGDWCKKPEWIVYLAGIIIHELAHNCFWCGGRPYRPQPQPFICPWCGARWDRPIDVTWEACAELLAHSCML